MWFAKEACIRNSLVRKFEFIVVNELSVSWWLTFKLFTVGMDVYGYLLAREGRLEDVENLGCRLFNISDQHAEPWVVSG